MKARAIGGVIVVAIVLVARFGFGLGTGKINMSKTVNVPDKRAYTVWFELKSSKNFTVSANTNSKKKLICYWADEKLHNQIQSQNLAGLSGMASNVIAKDVASFSDKTVKLGPGKHYIYFECLDDGVMDLTFSVKSD